MSQQPHPRRPTIKSGTSIPMPSVSLELGEYVVCRGPRADGTFRVLFEVPARLRPSDWSPTTPLPFRESRPDGSVVIRRGDLTDPREILAIQEDAAELRKRLQQVRLGGVARPELTNRRDLPNLYRLWEKTERFKAKKPRTQKGYSYHAGLILDWSASCNNPPVDKLSIDKIEAFLGLFDGRQTTKRHVKIVFKMMLDLARKLGWRSDNLLEDVTVAAPKTMLRLWEREDVLAGAWACIVAGQSSLGALLLTEWEIGQRLTDVRMFRVGAEYVPAEGIFRFWQEKTQAYVTIEISDELRALLECVRQADSLYLFVDRATGKPFAEQRLGHVWADIRKGYGLAERLQVRTLRHSCVVQLARAGCTVPEISAVTGHSPASAHQILTKYLPRDNIVAHNAQVKRGLIKLAQTA